MKQLQILNAALCAAGAALGLILAVVCLIYWVYLDEAPKIRAELPLLLVATAAFLGLMAAGALAYLGHLRHWTLRWGLQALPLLSLAGIGALFGSA